MKKVGMVTIEHNHKSGLRRLVCIRPSYEVRVYADAKDVSAVSAEVEFRYWVAFCEKLVPTP